MAYVGNYDVGYHCVIAPEETKIDYENELYDPRITRGTKLNVTKVAEFFFLKSKLTMNFYRSILLRMSDGSIHVFYSFVDSGVSHDASFIYDNLHIIGYDDIVMVKMFKYLLCNKIPKVHKDLLELSKNISI